MANSNPNFLNGVPEMVVLTLLSRQEMYGYQLVKSIQEHSEEQFAFGEGCIYPILHYLEQHRLVTSQRREVEGRSRHYYRLTTRGQKRLAELTRDWEAVVKGVNLVLGGHHA
jgi:PadR family transcriptional regulator PadR